MVKNVVIVESPAKARTIGRFLGRDYTVEASLGHIRDLPNGKLGVSEDGAFVPEYVIPKEKRKVIKALNDALKGASNVYLATDPDREGEAIAWHLTQAMKLGGMAVSRVVFHEITETAIKEAFANPRKIDEGLVNAQQTRRILDRLVGYKLSPLLWKKIRGGLSAGRVQSPALRMLVDREREIDAFQAKEYWRILAELSKRSGNGAKQRAAFTARLVAEKGVKGTLEVGDEAQAQAITGDLESASFTVAAVRQRENQRKPAAPFTTSTLQQEAFRKLRFAARRTMAVAQQLYEGLSIGAEGSVGLITYMRTDSVTVSQGAVQETRAFVKERFGAGSLPSSPRQYKTKAKNAQEAHEAVRPTSVWRDPEAIKQHLNRDQLRLYELIWKRMVASQMANAVFDSTTVDIDGSGPASAKTYVFQVKGQVQKFAGFLALYSEGKDTDDEEETEALPQLVKGEGLDLVKPLHKEQKFTQPPPRYTEASLVKALEENGIGRPSTYAPIITTIQERGYVKKESNALKPQPLGMIVNDLLRDSFADIIDLQFTARMEEGLDEIARGEKEWTPFLKEFNDPFEAALEKANASLAKVDEPTDETCDVCSKPMVVKKGRFGLFLACSGYPECKNTKPIVVKTGVSCPECGGDLLQRKSRKGKTFYGCGNYPKCTFATNLRPIPEPCPECKGLLTAFPRGGVRCARCDYKGRRPRARDSETQTEETEESRETEAVAVGE